MSADEQQQQQQASTSTTTELPTPTSTTSSSNVLNPELNRLAKDMFAKVADHMQGNLEGTSLSITSLLL